MNKCKVVSTTLVWGGFQRYFEHSSLHWSPWLSKQGLELESSHWREVARRLNKKNLVHLIDFWNADNMHWREPDNTQQWGVISLAEEVLIRRLLKVVSFRASLPLVSELSWELLEMADLETLSEPKHKGYLSQTPKIIGMGEDF